MVGLNMPITIGSGEGAQTVSDICNQIFPNLLPLIVFGIMFKLIKKEVKAQWILVIIAAIGIIGAFFGILA